MDYLEACEAFVTKKEAKYEIEVQHGLNFSDFVADCGNSEEYQGQVVLDWLGY